MIRLVAALAPVLAALAAAAAGSPPSAWPQWGGPNRNFVTPAADLATPWPEEGPRRLWQRPLGDGFSSIVTDGATLYTLYRDGADDVAVAMDAVTGRTRWDARYAAPFTELCSEQLGPAPRSAPLIAGDRLVTVSAGGMMNSFDRHTGARQWRRDLLEGSSGALRACGYSSSPLAHRLIILDEDGNLALATPGDAGLTVHAKAQVLGERAWTAPTLSGTTLYLRDRRQIMALELGTR